MDKTTFAFGLDSSSSSSSDDDIIGGFGISHDDMLENPAVIATLLKGAARQKRMAPGSDGDTVEFTPSPEFVELQKKKLKLMKEKLALDERKFARKSQKLEASMKVKRVDALRKKKEYKEDVVADPRYPSIDSMDTLNNKVNLAKDFKSFQKKKKKDPSHEDSQFPNGEYSESQDSIVRTCLAFDSLAAKCADSI
ncbi:unnamed protein product [Cylindrotheca closterium]|uniref:Uncharacterized protein n=1 Tax=Cylindrotheca closterium TaxID=2856 RepID=A0AAD2CRP6_9STRA|nr:unnamed protein product [Cylindrotheca closterium]